MSGNLNEGVLLEVIAGTYEEFLVGYQLRKFKDKYMFDQSFTNHAHSSSVRCIASSGQFVASGGGDEAIHILSIAKRQDVGTLQEQEGTITTMDFFKDSHLFTGSEDGTICVWDTRSWNCLKTLKGHKKGITGVSVHPSGKILISIASDKTMRTWNLIKGRAAFVTNLSGHGHLVRWAPDAERFAIAIESKLDIYDVETGKVADSVEFQKRISSVVFFTDQLIAIGGDIATVEVYNMESKTSMKFKAHENRVRDMHSIVSPVDSSHRWLITISSDGKIKVWDMDIENYTEEPELIASVDTTCRPTCMAIWTPSLLASKRKRVESKNVEDLVEAPSENPETVDSKEVGNKSRKRKLIKKAIQFKVTENV
ncbi:p21-activated protein kinase-interacting protein 1-like [Halotydeus destructor]|nr:p21-activated protein kinase-interacting protein 1-like [Halotydeus destructor]